MAGSDATQALARQRRRCFRGNTCCRDRSPVVGYGIVGVVCELYSHLSGTVRPLIASIDPDLPVSQLQTMAQGLRNQTITDQLIATLSAIFAGLATALAAVGLYAVLSYNVSERTRELGLRLALGASPGVLLRMVMKQICWIAAVAIVIVVVVAIGVGCVAEALLFGVSGYNVFAFGFAIVVISVVALGAGFLVAPMVALREQ